jgi:hypothetical protein
MVLSRHQNAGQYLDLLIANKTFENALNSNIWD